MERNEDIEGGEGRIEWTMQEDMSNWEEGTSYIHSCSSHGHHHLSSKLC